MKKYFVLTFRLWPFAIRLFSFSLTMSFPFSRLPTLVPLMLFPLFRRHMRRRFNALFP